VSRALLALLALGCAPVLGVVDPTDEPVVTRDPYTWTGEYLPMALDRILLRGRAEAVPRCLQLVLVYPGWDNPEWSVQVGQGWGVQHAWASEEPCPDEPIWPDGAVLVDDVSGVITPDEGWPPDVTLDIVVSTPLATEPIAVDTTVEVGG